MGRYSACDYGVFNTTSPYLTTHYLGQGEKIINDYPDTVRLGDVYEGYIPANPEKHREIWSGQIKQALIDELEMSDLEAQSVMSKLVDMELEEAFVYLEENMIGIVQDICTKIVPITKERQKKSTHI